VCVIVNCKVQSRAISKCAMNAVISPKHIYHHNSSLHNISETLSGCHYMDSGKYAFTGAHFDGV
jgi:hypothetical protein